MDIKEIIKEQLKSLGKELQMGTHDAAVFLEQRARHLSTLVGDPNFQDAVIVERDNCALKLGILMTDAADAADARAVGIIQGVLSVGAALLT